MMEDSIPGSDTAPNPLVSRYPFRTHTEFRCPSRIPAAL